MVIMKLKERIKSLSGNLKEEKVKQELEEIKTINIELDHRVTKLVTENEHLKQTYKQLYDSIKSSPLKDTLRKLKGKVIVDEAITLHPIDSKLLKIDVAPLAPKLQNNRTVDYLKHTQEETATLREIVENKKLLNPLNTSLDYACEYTKRIQELLIILKQTCPCINDLGVNLPTSASRSQPSGNTKKDRIQQTQSSAKKNKLEAYLRNAITSLQNKKSVVNTKDIASVPNSKLNINSDLQCVICNGCLFSDNHDSCVLEFINSVNARVKSKSVKKPLNRKIWNQQEKITTTAKVPLRRPIPLESNTSKPVVTLVYSRKPKESKNNVPVSKSKINKSLSADKKEPNKSWRSTISNVPSSSTVECKLSKLFFGDMMTSSPICLLSKASKTKSWLWHRRLSHLNFGAINHLARQGLVRGLPKLKFEKDHLCSACTMGKSKKKSHKPKYEDTNQENLYLLHMDLCGPMCVESVNGKTSGPAFHEMTSATISLGLVPKPTSSTLFVPPSRNDWDLLFQPLFDELLTLTPSVDPPAPKVIAPIDEVIAQEPPESTGSPSSTIVDQDAPSPSKSQTTPKTQPHVIPHDVKEENNDTEVVHMGNDPFFGMPILEVASDQSSSTDSTHAIEVRIVIYKLDYISLYGFFLSRAMDMTIDQQVALDEALAPHARRLRIGKSNFRLRSDITSKESTLQLVYDVLRLTPFYKAFLVNADAQILWGMYHKKNIDFAYLLWEEFVYQVKHKDAKKRNEMYYPTFTKVIIHFFMTKDPSIPRRNKVNWHYVRDDQIFTTIKLVSRHQNNQQFGAILPIELTNEDIENSAAYKEYYAVASGAAPPKTKASVMKTQSSFDTTITPTTAAGTRLSTSEKGKQPAKSSKVKGADERTGILPGVLDVPTDESDEEISWKSSNKEEDDDEVDDRSDDQEDKDRQDDDDQKDDDQDDDDDDQKDDDQDDNDDDQDTDNDGDDFIHPNKEGHDAEDDDEELYRDVNINLEGRVVQMTDVHTTQEFEDTHVALTPVNPDDIDSLIESTPWVDVQASTTVAPLTLTAPTLPPPTILVISQVLQAPTPPTTAPSTFLQDLPNFGLLFGFDHRLKTLEANFSEFVQTNQFAGAVSFIPEIVERYTDQRMNEAIIKEQVKEQVKVQVSKILPKIKKTMNEQLEAEVLTRSSNSSKTSYVVASDLSELELKKILIGDSVTFKRRRDDADKDEEPSAGSGRGFKKTREGKERESISAPKEKVTKTTGKSTKGSKSHQKTASESAPAEEPMQTIQDLEEPSHQEFETGAADDQPIAEAYQHHECDLAKQNDSRSSFNELMDTPVDFSAFLMNRLKVDILIPELLAGPTYELMKGSCKSLQYPHNLLKPLPLIPNSRGRHVIPFDHFINNDLQYLRGDASSHKYTTSVTKTKVADYGHIKWIEDLVPRIMWSQEPVSYDKYALWGISHWGRKRQHFYRFAVNRESARDVYSKHRIIAVTELQIVEWHNYKHLDWITVRRDDDKLYKFKEGNFKRLHIQDIEDMLLLLVQGKLTNLTVQRLSKNGHKKHRHPTTCRRSSTRCRKLPKEAQPHKVGYVLILLIGGL
nr:integrase, catalytic region, zinc finger, CCHC-type, peptidase aspartic, catalytic [Tanacetum cinerariifolium]GEW70056.1 integrase, catalytic region, zinc finger, CCHC-type, peptidase aspartic, catalytic [Tanacetum cinerariifolium]